MDDIFILTGTNLGNREKNLAEALERISPQTQLIHCSSLYESEPWGYNSRNPFLNQAVRLSSELTARDLLTYFQNIERGMGRKSQSPVYEDRLIDIDILFYGQNVIHADDLIIPHPRLHLRKFALLPVVEIAESFIHPLLKRSLEELLKECQDESTVRKL